MLKKVKIKRISWFTGRGRRKKTNPPKYKTPVSLRLFTSLFLHPHLPACFATSLHSYLLTSLSAMLANIPPPAFLLFSPSSLEPEPEPKPKLPRSVNRGTFLVSARLDCSWKGGGGGGGYFNGLTWKVTHIHESACSLFGGGGKAVSR